MTARQRRLAPPRDAANLVMEAARARQAGRACRLRRPRARRVRRRGDARLRRRRASPFEVVPGVAAAVGVPAYAGVPLRDAQGADVRFVDARSAVRALLDRGRAPATGPLVVSTTLDSVAAAAGELVAAGRKPDTPLTVTVAGTTTRQRTWTATLGTIAQALKQAKVLPSPDGGRPVIAVVGERSAAAQRDQLSWFESKPLFGWQVLVPRTKEQAASLSDQLRSYGAVPHEVPTIAVEPPRTPQQMERAVKGLVTGRYEWIAFTSVNAVKAVREKFEEYGLDARAFAGIKVAAVGEQTAKALVAFGVKPDLVPSGEQSAAGLLEDWPPYDPVFDPIDRVFLPRADIATETLVAGLIELGWEVDDVTAYRTVRASPPPAETREAIKGGGFDAVLFTSSSTVRNLVGIAGQAAQRDGHRLYRAGHGQDRRGARAARRRHVAGAVGARAGRGARGLRCGAARGGARRRGSGHPAQRAAAGVAGDAPVAEQPVITCPAPIRRVRGMAVQYVSVRRRTAGSRPRWWGRRRAGGRRGFLESRMWTGAGGCRRSRRKSLLLLLSL